MKKKLRRVMICVFIVLAAVLACQTRVEAKAKTKVYMVDPLGVKTFSVKKGVMTIKLASNRRSSIWNPKAKYDHWTMKSKRTFKYKVAKNIKYTMREGYSDPDGGRIEQRMSYKAMKKYFKKHYTYEYPMFDWDCNCYIKIRNKRIVEVSLVEAW